MSNAAKSTGMQSHLIYVTVTFQFGVPYYAYTFYPGTNDASTATVHPGDQVAWYVAVFSGGALSYPAYELIFADPSFFGMGSLSVPAGGHSPYISVHALLLAGTKYTLRVHGISLANDPVMQTDPGGPRPIGKAPANYQILWDQAGAVWLVGQPNVPMPAVLPVNAGDIVTFLSQPQKPFGVYFDAAAGHQTLITPFTPNQLGANSIIPGVTVAGNEESTGAQTVLPDNDPNTSFVFHLESDGKANSTKYTIQIS